MTLALPDRGNGTLSKDASHTILEFLDEEADVLAIGPGIGVSNDTESLLKTLIKKSDKPSIIDADGLNSLKGDLFIFSKANAPIILTPHPGEMARLLKQPASHHEINTIEKHRIKTSLSFCRKTKTYLVLKGVPTIISSPDGRTFISLTGNPGMATGGTGDVLTGMIAGFLGQGLSPLKASILGVFLHGTAGDIAAAEKGLHSLTAGDIIEKIPSAFSCLKSDG
jgi:NAD(P)H-hydrate epimerase